MLKRLGAVAYIIFYWGWFLPTITIWLVRHAYLGHKIEVISLVLAGAIPTTIYVSIAKNIKWKRFETRNKNRRIR